ncbi:MAG: alpha/beta fold hydrolase, partial [Alphaproteobacteria bacterium]
MSAYTDNSFKVLAGARYINIAYRDWGDADNPDVIVCCHGLSRNRKDFDDLAAVLSVKYRVLSVDMPGRGDSEWLDDKSAYGYPLYETVCASMIALTGADDVTWIGTSMGGILGMRLAAKRGSPIKRLVLNDIGPFIPKEGRADNQANFGKDPRYATEAEGIQNVRETRSVFGPFSEKDWDKFGRDSLRQLPDGQWTLHYDPGLDPMGHGLQAADRAHGGPDGQNGPVFRNLRGSWRRPLPRVDPAGPNRRHRELHREITAMPNAVKLGYLLPTRERIMVGEHKTRPILDLARHAEAVGFDAVWIGDSVTAKPRHDALSML